MRKVQKREVEHMAEHRKDIEIKEQNDEVEIDLGRLIQSMWKSFRKLWWLVLALVTAGAAVFTVYQRFYNKPLYACTATFTVGTGDESSGSYSFYYDSTTADQMSKTFPYILESSFFRNTLLEQLGTDTLNGTITAETIEDSNVVTMRAESPSAEDARAILDTAIAVYPDTARFVLGDIQFNMLDEPSAPTEPFNQMGIKKSVAFGALGGLALSVCILGVLALLRQTARDQDEMKEITSLRCLAAVPLVRLKARRNQKRQKISVLDERLPYGYRESMRGLKLRLERKMDGSGGKGQLRGRTGGGPRPLPPELVQGQGAPQLQRAPLGHKGARQGPPMRPQQPALVQPAPVVGQLRFNPRPPVLLPDGKPAPAAVQGKPLHAAAPSPGLSLYPMRAAGGNARGGG